MKSKLSLFRVRYQPVSRVLLAVLMVGVSGMLWLPARPVAAAAAAPTVTGNLLTVGGVRWVSSGVDMYIFPPDPTYDSNLNTVFNRQYPNLNAIFAKMVSLNINTVRVSLDASAYLTSSSSSYMGNQSQYLDKVQTLVTDANAHGLYVDFGWWDSLHESASFLNDYTKYFTAMHDVYTRLGANPMVFYEPWNEPNGYDWSSWQPMMQTTIKYWRVTLGYKGILLLDTPSWASEFDPTQAANIIAYDKSVNGLGKGNVVLANHHYGNANTSFLGTADENSWNSTIEQYVGKYPIIGTEYGYYNVPAQFGYDQPHYQFDSQFFNYLATTAVPAGLNGAMVFCWNWVDPNSQTGTDALTLNEAGTTSSTNFWSKMGSYVTRSTSPTPTATVAPSKTLGDLNGDGTVNAVDLSILISDWGTANATADINKSGKVDVLDLSILLANWGK